MNRFYSLLIVAYLAVSVGFAVGGYRIMNSIGSVGTAIPIRTLEIERELSGLTRSLSSLSQRFNDLLSDPSESTNQVQYLVALRIADSAFQNFLEHLSKDMPSTLRAVLPELTLILGDLEDHGPAVVELSTVQSRVLYSRLVDTITSLGEVYVLLNQQVYSVTEAQISQIGSIRTSIRLLGAAVLVATLLMALMVVLILRSRTNIEEKMAQLRDERTRMNVMVGNLSDGVAVFGINDELLYWNHKFTEFPGFPESLAVKGCPYWDFVNYHLEQEGESRRRILRDEIWGSPATRLYDEPYQVEDWWPNGKFLRLSITPISNFGFIVSYSDATQAKLYEDSLREARDAIEEADGQSHGSD